MQYSGSSSRVKELISELSECYASERGSTIRKPEDLLPYLRKWGKKKQECFIVVTLSADHRVIHSRAVTVGILNKTLVHPREVFRTALKDNAAAILVAHNHPSGQVVPSEDDNDITKRLLDAAKVLGIKLLDHIIFCEDEVLFYSYQTDGRFSFI